MKVDVEDLTISVLALGLGFLGLAGYSLSLGSERRKAPAPVTVSASSARERRLRPPGPMTYCPGPNCALEEKARAACEKRPVPGVFSAEPDFVCRFHGDVHRVVCDDLDDPKQCGLMTHSDLEYARAELSDFARVTPFWDMDFQKLECDEGDREITCSFPTLSTGRIHEHSPIHCNWMGCSLMGGDEEWRLGF